MLPGASHPNSRTHTQTIFLTGPRIPSQAGKNSDTYWSSIVMVTLSGSHNIPRLFSSGDNWPLNLYGQPLHVASAVNVFQFTSLNAKTKETLLLN